MSGVEKFAEKVPAMAVAPVSKRLLNRILIGFMGCLRSCGNFSIPTDVHPICFTIEEARENYQTTSHKFLHWNGKEVLVLGLFSQVNYKIS